MNELAVVVFLQRTKQRQEMTEWEMWQKFKLNIGHSQYLNPYTISLNHKNISEKHSTAAETQVAFIIE